MQVIFSSIHINDISIKLTMLNNERYSIDDSAVGRWSINVLIMNYSGDRK